MTAGQIIPLVLIFAFPVLLYILNIKRRKIAAKQTAETHDLAKLMLDSIPFCCQVWSRNLQIIDCNEAGVKLYGFKNKQEFKDRFLQECSPEYQNDGQRSDKKAAILVNKAFEEGYCIFDWTHRLPDEGTLIPSEITLVRAKHGDDYVVIGTTRDLRKQVIMMNEIEEKINELAIQKNMLQTILDTIPDQIFCKDLNSKYILVNKSMLDQHNAERDNVIGKGDADGLGIPADAAEKIISNDKKTISENRIIKYDEYLPRPGGSAKFFETIKIPLAHNGVVTGLVGIARDVTEKKRTDKMLAAALEAANGANHAAVTLLASDVKSFENTLLKAMETIAKAAKVDHVYICKNDTINGVLCHTQIYEWPLGCRSQFGTERITNLPYKNIGRGFEERLSNGNCVNMITRNITPDYQMSPDMQMFFTQLGILSVLVAPIFIKGRFWGYAGFDDCKQERVFSGMEEMILRSCSLVFASALLRNEMESEIARANEFTKLMLNSAPLCCQLWDKDLNNIDCNDAAVKLFGFNNKQELQERYGELYPEFQSDGQNSIEKGTEALKKAFDEGYYTLDWSYKMPDNTIMPAQITLVRVKYGTEYVVAEYTRDMREHNKMMEEIEYQSNMLNTVNNVSTILLGPDISNFDENLLYSMGILAETVDVDRVYIWKNHTIDGKLYYSQIFEWSLTAEPQQGSEYTTNIPQDKLLPGMEEHLKKGHCINGIVREMLPEYQAYLTMQNIKSIILVPVFLHDELWGFVGFDDCNKERIFSKNEEMILRSASRMIANAMMRQNMSRNLQDALESAETANHAKSDFLAKMSHEIRTPMNAIIGITEIELKRKESPDEIKKALGKIHSSGHTLLGIINDILDLSKIETGRLELVSAKYETAGLISDTINLNIMRIGDKQIEFELIVSENLPEQLIGDELRIKQIMNNLLSNAIKYTDKGRVTLNIDIEKDVREPQQLMQMDAERIIISVSDTGQGMTAQQLEQIFDQYARFNLEINSSKEGTGLGMSITKSLVDMMQGTITVNSKPGIGTHVTVSIPQIVATDGVIGKEQAQNLKNFNISYGENIKKAQISHEYIPGCSVLIVDDLEINLYVAKGLMEPYGMKIETAASGFQALEKINNGSVYDIIFMDHMMPEMDGIETTKRLREAGYTGPVVALTANAIVGQVDLFLKNGFDGFIAKPIDTVQLDEIIKKFVLRL